MGTLRNELEKYRSDVVNHTHVSLTNPMGKFEITRRVLDEWWVIYNNSVIAGESTGLAEKPQDILPILVDCDLKMKVKGEVPKALYTKEQAEMVIGIYQEALSQIVEGYKEYMGLCILLEKPLASYPRDELTIVKNGFHLHFPYIFMSGHNQSVFLLPRVKAAFTQLNPFKDMPLESPGTIIDGAYCRNSTRAYASGVVEQTLEEALCRYRIYNTRENVICFSKELVEEAEGGAFGQNYTIVEDETRGVVWHLPQILSVILHGRVHCMCEPRKNVSVPAEAVVKKKKIGELKRAVARTSVKENIEIAKQLVPLLSTERASSRNEWMEVGWTLYNIGHGCKEAYDLWLEFSGKCPEKYCEARCEHDWGKMYMRDLTIATLRYYAAIDSPDEYAKLKSNIAAKHISESLRGSHNDIAKALYEMYGTEFVCASIATKRWFQFEGNSWKEIDSGTTLRKQISDELAPRYVKFGSQLMRELAAATEDSERDLLNFRIKNVQKMINNLKSAPYKANVMKECMDVFYNEKFLSKLDSNPHLIAYKNGVYDLEAGCLREGRPEDYLSIQMGINYVNFVPSDPRVLDVYEFLEKVFPDETIRRYFMDVYSEIFVGGNRRKLVPVWSGEGDNAKSVTQTIIERILGQYAIKLPTSLITGKRTQASSACPELARAGHGVRWAVLQEPEKKDVLNVGVLKELSGNDTFFARTLYDKGGEIKPMFKIALICNDPPQMPYSDNAVWNRIRVIPFESVFCSNAPVSVEEQFRLKRFPVDRNFDDRIDGMLEAFNWVLMYHRENDLSTLEPDKVKAATNHYKEQNDAIQIFVKERTEPAEGKSVMLMVLYNAFKMWFRDSVPNSTVPVKHDFQEYIAKVYKIADGKVAGLALKSEEGHAVPL
jgi:P4 family phage/plasmid primase-like protien